MNKKLKEAFAQAGINFNGSLGYGVVNGFETNVRFSNFNPITIHFSCYTTDEQKRQVLQQLREATIKFSNFGFSKFGLTMLINDWTAGSLAKRLIAVLEKVCGILTSDGALGIGYCPVCGNVLDFEQSKKCNVDGMTISIDNDCVKDINNLINAENKDSTKLPTTICAVLPARLWEVWQALPWLLYFTLRDLFRRCRHLWQSS